MSNFSKLKHYGILKNICSGVVIIYHISGKKERRAEELAKAMGTDSLFL
jgi:hypothetical protein